jgi:hypothetical protein
MSWANKSEFGSQWSLCDEGTWNSVWIDVPEGDRCVNLTEQDLLDMLRVIRDNRPVLGEGGTF